MMAAPTERVDLVTAAIAERAFARQEPCYVTLRLPLSRRHVAALRVEFYDAMAERWQVKPGTAKHAECTEAAMRCLARLIEAKREMRALEDALLPKREG